MKSKSELAAVVYTTLTALVATKSNVLGGMPNGLIYSQLMGCFDIGEWTHIVASMKHGGLITESNFVLKITPKGEAMHAKLHAIYQEAQNATRK